MDFYRFAKMSGGDAARLVISGEIVTDEPWYTLDGEVTASNSFRRALAMYEGKPLVVVIDSIGGDVGAGVAMYEMLRQRKGETWAEVYTAYSSATLVLAGCDKGRRRLSPAARLLYHNPATIAAGDHRDIERARVFLEKTKEAVIAAYQDASGMDHDAIAEMMDKETVFTAQEAIAAGFADDVLEAQTASMLGGWSPKEIADISRKATAAMLDRIRAADKVDEDKTRARMRLYASEMLERG